MMNMGQRCHVSPRVKHSSSLRLLRIIDQLTPEFGALGPGPGPALVFPLRCHPACHSCNAKVCTTNNFPLKLTNIKLALREAKFNPDFLRGFLPRIEWNALIQASREVLIPSISYPSDSRGFFYKIGDTPLSSELPEMLDDNLLKQLHHVLLEVCQYASCHPSRP